MGARSGTVLLAGIASALALGAVSRRAAADPAPAQPGLHTASAPLPMVSSTYDARVVGPLVEVVVRQAFRNPTDHAVEATYLYPLPLDAAVSSLVITTGERRIVGDVRSRAEARAAYEAAVAAGQTGALLERARADVFTQSVTGIPAGGTVTIELRWDTQARRVGDQWELRLPMVLAPRVVPGAATGDPVIGAGSSADTDRAPDASRVTPVLAAGAGDVAATVNLTLDGASDVTSPTDELIVTPRTGGADATLTMARVDHDVAIRYRAAAPSGGWFDTGDGMLAALVERPVPGSRGAVDVVIAVDPAISATRTGAVQGGRLVGALIRDLTSSDRYALLAGTVALPWQAGGAALDARAQAALARPAAVTLDALLGAAAGQCAARDGGSASGRCTIVLVSDALAANDGEVRAAVSALTPVLTVAVGPAPNHGLLAAIATLSGGASRAVLAADDPRDLVAALLADAAGSRQAPRLAFTGVDIEEQEPKVVPALGAGQAVLVLARARGGRLARRAKLKVDGNLFGLLAPRAATTVDEPMTTSGLLARRWAAAKLARLEATGAPGSDIEALALAYGLVSSRTALVAVGAEVVVEGGVRHSVAVAVAPPAGTAGALATDDDLKVTAGLSRAASVAAAPPPPPPPPPGGGDMPDTEEVPRDERRGDKAAPIEKKADVAVYDPAPSGGGAGDASDEASDDRWRADAPTQVGLADAEAIATSSPRIVSYLALAAGAAVADADAGARPTFGLGLRLTTRRGAARLGLGVAGWLVLGGEDATGVEVPRELALRPTIDAAVRRRGGWVEVGASLGVHLAAHPGLAYALALRGPRLPFTGSRAWLVPVLRWDGTLRPATLGTDYPGTLTFGLELAR